ncbi:TPA: hypothetical protein MD627_004667 [Citrobacter freundii]|nr:hypothetical protein [Citrobacter freundii]
MKINTDDFPRVRMDYSIESDASSNDILIAISKLLQKKQPFVFICSVWGRKSFDTTGRRLD